MEQQLTIYVGSLTHGVGGGLIAGALFIIPGYIAILRTACLRRPWRNALYRRRLLRAQGTVPELVIAAIWGLGPRTLRSNLQKAIAALDFLALFVFDAPVPLLVIGAGVIGLVARPALPALTDTAESVETRLKQGPAGALPWRPSPTFGSRPSPCSSSPLVRRTFMRGSRCFSPK